MTKTLANSVVYSVVCGLFALAICATVLAGGSIPDFATDPVPRMASVTISHGPVPPPDPKLAHGPVPPPDPKLTHGPVPPPDPKLAHGPVPPPDPKTRAEGAV